MISSEKIVLLPFVCSESERRYISAEFKQLDESLGNASGQVVFVIRLDCGIVNH